MSEMMDSSIATKVKFYAILKMQFSLTYFWTTTKSKQNYMCVCVCVCVRLFICVCRCLFKCNSYCVHIKNIYCISLFISLESLNDYNSF
jgi:hypothetical protein